MTAAYAATKAYVLSLGLGAPRGAPGHRRHRHDAYVPGPTATGFQARADMTDSALVRSGLDSAETVVDAGYAAMKTGKPYLVTGTTSRLFAFGHAVPAADRGEQDRRQRPATRELTSSAEVQTCLCMKENIDATARAKTPMNTSPMLWYSASMFVPPSDKAFGEPGFRRSEG